MTLKMTRQMTRIATIAVGALAPLIMFAPNAAAGDTLCPYVTAPAAQCQTDGGPTDYYGNGASPVEYPVGFPGGL